MGDETDMAALITRRTARGIAVETSALIRSGRIPVGTRLPTVRALAYALGVSPATISEAWSELRHQKMIRGRGRQGSWVIGDTIAPRPSRMASVGHFREDTIDLSLAAPDRALAAAARAGAGAWRLCGERQQLRAHAHPRRAACRRRAALAVRGGDVPRDERRLQCRLRRAARPRHAGRGSGDRGSDGHAPAGHPRGPRRRDHPRRARRRGSRAGLARRRPAAQAYRLSLSAAHPFGDRTDGLPGAAGCPGGNARGQRRAGHRGRRYRRRVAVDAPQSRARPARPGDPYSLLLEVAGSRPSAGGVVGHARRHQADPVLPQLQRRLDEPAASGGNRMAVERS